MSSLAGSHPELVIYQREDGRGEVSVKLEGDSVWLTQGQLSELYDTTKQNIGQHIRNIFIDGELDENSVVKKIFTTAADGKGYQTAHYNLDMIVSLGYRINSKTATRFRQWATTRLTEYIVKGFTMDDARLKKLGGGDYFRELLARIRDIRSSEKVLYRQVLDLYATSIDYDPKSLYSIKFFKIVQNKLHYAAHKHTAAEIIYDRADADKAFMGMTTFAGDLPILEEVRIAKNYLSENELRKLNGLVSAYFDLAESRALDGKTTSMAEYIKMLDKLTVNFGEGALLGAGKVSNKEAAAKAEREYRKFQVKTMSSAERDYFESIKAIEKAAKKK